MIEVPENIIITDSLVVDTINTEKEARDKKERVRHSVEDREESNNHPRRLIRTPTTDCTTKKILLFINMYCKMKNQVNMVMNSKCIFLKQMIAKLNSISNSS